MHLLVKRTLGCVCLVMPRLRLSCAAGVAESCARVPLRHHKMISMLMCYSDPGYSLADRCDFLLAGM
jgi:hypothetical protein